MPMGKKFTGRPATSTRALNSEPAGVGASNSACGRPLRADVTYSVRRSSPPKHTIVGHSTGVAIRCSTLPLGERRSTQAPSYMATQ